MKRKRRIKKYRSLADVRSVKVLLDFASGLPVTSKQYNMLNNRMKKERKYTAKQFPGTFPMVEVNYPREDKKEMRKMEKEILFAYKGVKDE